MTLLLRCTVYIALLIITFSLLMIIEKDAQKLKQELIELEKKWEERYGGDKVQLYCFCFC